MENTIKPILSDREKYPDDDYIFSLIGDKKVLWHSIMDHLNENIKDSNGTWNYYNDGKQWLFKAVHKKKTIFWLSIIEGTFRITFYFGDKAEPLIEDSALPDIIKNEFKTSKRYGKIRGITIVINHTDDVENVKKLIGIKIKIK